MSFFFQNFPKVDYDLFQNGVTENITNMSLRFKIQAILKDKTAVYYNYTIKDSDRSDVIAFKYYDDERLDWIILLTNDIYCIYYDWPMNYDNFQNYIRMKYGSVSTAQSTTHTYEYILAAAMNLPDGTVVPERTLEVDETYAATLPAVSVRTVSKYDWEDNLNEAKRNIKIIDKKYIPGILDTVEDIFSA